MVNKDNNAVVTRKAPRRKTFCCTARLPAHYTRPGRIVYSICTRTLAVQARALRLRPSTHQSIEGTPRGGGKVHNNYSNNVVL